MTAIEQLQLSFSRRIAGPSIVMLQDGPLCGAQLAARMNRRRRFKRPPTDGTAPGALPEIRTALSNDSHSYRLVRAVPLTDKTDLTILCIGHDGFIVLVQPQNIRGTGVDTNATTRTGFTVYFNSRHEAPFYLEKPNVNFSSGGQARRETIPARVRPIASGHFPDAERPPF